nr:MAG TPA: hypothetical protein [Caudoviricetes sp.]
MRSFALRQIVLAHLLGSAQIIIVHRHCCPSLRPSRRV